METALRSEQWRERSRIALSLFYLVAGVFHLAYPGPFLAITPGWVPHPALVIAATGVCEIAGAAGLWLPPFRRLAGIGLAIYAVCVFPANVKHAIDTLSAHPSPLQWTYHSLRLPLQPVIVWVALYAGRANLWQRANKADC